MKKISIVFLSLSVLAGASLALAQSEKAVSLGQRSEEVKTIQEALKSDKSIYPEGLTTGYFGSATKKAVARVQARCALPQTGVVDDDTEKCIFPVDYQITVVLPNGGETWDRSQIQAITWKVLRPIPTITPLPTTTPLPTITPVPTTTPTPTTTVLPVLTTTSISTSSMPFWSKASIDLFKKQKALCIQCIQAPCPPCLPTSVFVKHLATVDLFSGSYSWKISNDIANGLDYVIRVSVGPNIVPLYRAEKEGTSVTPSDIWPGGNWDESDNPFTITGNVVPPSNDLSRVIKILQEMADQLAKAIQLLREMNQIQ